MDGKECNQRKQASFRSHLLTDSIEHFPVYVRDDSAAADYVFSFFESLNTLSYNLSN